MKAVNFQFWIVNPYLFFKLHLKTYTLNNFFKKLFFAIHCQVQDFKVKYTKPEGDIRVYSFHTLLFKAEIWF